MRRFFRPAGTLTTVCRLPAMPRFYFHLRDGASHDVDFEGLEFDLSSDFFEKVVDYGIRLLPTNGHPISVPGYGRNNGYYSHNLDLVLSSPKETRSFDITECQEVSD